MFVFLRMKHIHSPVSSLLIQRTAFSIRSPATAARHQQAVPTTEERLVLLKTAEKRYKHAMYIIMYGGKRTWYLIGIIYVCCVLTPQNCWNSCSVSCSWLRGSEDCFFR